MDSGDMNNTAAAKTITTVTDRDGNTYSTKRKGMTHAIIGWDWSRTVRSASWTGKGIDGVNKVIAQFVHTDDIEIIEL